ncbi:KpsF/GutQ family sugar-phosphate isomerase [Rhizobium mesoamericanum]|uniref:KpsF/GutQ family sugar-phosphate isomerase n=1 Tax=Rhizobium mesoamericanum TaxID=1079800 RepID=UPI000412F0C5|nr:SIS domain-containing protein [Rhizobium mesoamericanum]
MNIEQRAKAIFEAEAQAIQAIPIDESFARVVKLIEHCGGKVIVTGIGKAGFVARKFAALLCSTGTPAAFMHPAEAAHGDLGLIGPGDCLVAFSTSGKTREVIEMIDLSRHLGQHSVVGITSHPDSKLRDRCDCIIDMGVIQEPCGLGLTPTASMAVMAAIGDALALILMERKSFSREEYGLRHDSGYLGELARNTNIT